MKYHYQLITVLLLLTSCSHKGQTPPAPEGKLQSINQSASALVRRFGALPEIDHVRLSPSGKYIAYFQNSEDKTYLVTRDLATDQTHFVIKSDEQKLRMTKFLWANDERLLVSVHFPSSRGWVNSEEGRLIAINRDGTESNMNLVKDQLINGSLKNSHTPQHGDNILAVLPDDPRHVLISLDYREALRPDVYRLDIYTGELQLLKRNNYAVHEWLADKSGNLRAGIAIDKNQSRQIFVKSIKSDDWNPLPGAEDIRNILGFDPNSDRLYFSALHEGRLAIFRQDIAKPNAKPELMASDPKYGIMGPLVSAQGQPVGVHFATEGIRSIFWDTKAKARQDRINRALPGRNNLFVNSSNNGKLHIVVSSNATQPAEIYLFDETTNELSMLAETYPQLKPDQLVSPRPISFKARDGLALEGYLTLPKGSQTTSFPTVVLPHGGPGSRDVASFNYWSQFLSSHGWAVLQVNFRGSAGYGEEFFKAGFKRWGLEMQDDVTDGVQWLIDQKIADPKKICIVGNSFGGYTALMGAAKTPDLYRCAVSFAGVSNLPGLVSTLLDYFNMEKITNESIGDLWTDRQRLKENSPINLVKQIRTPLLIVHGEQDRNVPVSQSRDMVEALKDSGFNNYEYLELPFGDHQLTHAEDRIQFFTALENFLIRHLN